MSNIKFKNFARSTLAIGAASGATSLTVAAGTGLRFPTLGAGEYFYLTLENSSLVREIVKVTARATDVLTVVRAQDNTTAQAWNAGDVASLRFNAAAIIDGFAGAIFATSATGSAIFPSGSTAQRDVAPLFGYMRANSTLNRIEWWNGSAWTSTIGAAAGANSDITSLSAITSINGGQLYGNVIKNGNKLYAPHGTSATVTAGTAVPTASLGYYTTGMFYSFSTGANVTLAQVAGSDATNKRDQYTGAASVISIGHGIRLEAQDTAHLAGQVVTYTVELANSLLTSVGWAVYYANTADTFGTIATPTKTLAGSGTFTVTSTVTKYTATFTMPAGATTGIEILLTVGAQTSGTWTIGREDFRIGSVSPSYFETPEIGETIHKVQRYYERVSGGASSIAVAQYGLTGNGFQIPFSWKVTKRTNPTLSKQGTWTVTNCSQPTVGGAGLDSCFIQSVVTSTAQASFATVDSTTYIDASAYIP